MSEWLRLLGDRTLRWYWLGRILSLVAASVVLVATPTAVYQLTSSALWVSALVAVHGIPYLVLGPVAGAVADRNDRSLILRTCELIIALAIATLPVAAAFDRLTPVHIVIAVAVARTAFVFADAANFGLVPALAPPGRLAAVTALLFATSSVVEMVGPGLVGAMSAFLPGSFTMALGASASVLAYLCFRFGRLPSGSAVREVPPGMYRAILDGARWLVSHPRVRSTIALGVAVTVSQGVFVSQVVPWAVRRLDVPADGGTIGLLFSAWAVGGLVATVVVPALTRTRGERSVAFAGMWVAAAGAIGCAFATVVPLALAMTAVWGSGYLSVVLATVVWRQLSTPDRLRSRVNTAARMAAYGIGYPLGGLLGGWVTTLFGPQVAMGGVGIVVVGVAVLALRGMRGTRGRA
ncbi:putative MFS family arabinose efflux permease [Promicromonospora sp. AC04]|uniref:MFS transporter n=1 Tax=Promicromonospora sp. AC04 TaxID=2135723 RepID=UPI000D34C0A8|nr:MFS transporter [Promicromonospora sp. AC04]PUB31924.1 putative MFS family arabinose efflux permease [Promicromonospora sp. AC04]